MVRVYSTTQNVPYGFLVIADSFSIVVGFGSMISVLMFKEDLTLILEDLY